MHWIFSTPKIRFVSTVVDTVVATVEGGALSSAAYKAVSTPSKMLQMQKNETKKRGAIAAE